MKSAEISRVHMIKRCLVVLVFVMGLHNIALAAPACEKIKCDAGYYWSGDDCKSCKEVTPAELQSAGVTKDMLWCPGYLSDCDDKYKGLHTCKSFESGWYAIDADAIDEIPYITKNTRVKNNEEAQPASYLVKRYSAYGAGDLSTPYYKCKLSEVYCNPGMYVPAGKSECNGHCSELDKKYQKTAAYYCPGGFVKINHQNLDSGVDRCDANSISGVIGAYCVKCPDGMQPNTKTIKYNLVNPSESFEMGLESGPYNACVRDINKTDYTKDTYYVNCSAISGDINWNIDPEHSGIWGLCKEEIESASKLQGVDLSFDKTARVDPNTLAGNYVVLPSVGCDKGNITVDGQCVPCTSNSEWVKFAKESRMYCPGGLVLKDSNGNYPGPLKQLKKCPKYKKPNDNLDDCECIYDDVKSDCKPTSLSHEEIYYGPLGKDGADALYKQCWTKKTKSVYRKCMGFDD